MADEARIQTDNAQRYFAPVEGLADVVETDLGQLIRDHVMRNLGPLLGDSLALSELT